MQLALSGCASAQFLLLLMAASLLSTSSAAGLEIVVRSSDPPGVGFNDPTPTDPVADNAGETLGEQRRNAIEQAAQAWRQALDGPLPVVIEVTMPELPCGVSGSSRSNGYVSGGDGLEPDWVYPVALAERISGVSQNGDAADILLEFNGSDCPDAGPQWYLGMDGEPPAGTTDLLMVAAHEIAHGLGFESLVNPSDGQALMEQPGLDPFSRLLFDVWRKRFWHELTREERVYSAQAPRGLVWGGERAHREAISRLRLGAPVLRMIPEHDAFSGITSVPSLQQAFDPVEARVRSVLPADGCSPPSPTSVEHVLLVAEGDCSPSRLAQLGAEAGALAVLEVESGSQVPPPTFGRRELRGDGVPVIPVMRVSASDGELLDTTVGVSVSLSVDMSTRQGADEAGRPLMYTPNPVAPGASLSHWDSSLSQSALLEPTPSPDLQDLDLAMERAVLLDIGWGSTENRNQAAAGGCKCATIGTSAQGTRGALWACWVALALYARRRSASLRAF